MERLPWGEGAGRKSSCFGPITGHQQQVVGPPNQPQSPTVFGSSQPAPKTNSVWVLPTGPDILWCLGPPSRPQRPTAFGSSQPALTLYSVWVLQPTQMPYKVCSSQPAPKPYNISSSQPAPKSCSVWALPTSHKALQCLGSHNEPQSPTAFGSFQPIQMPYNVCCSHPALKLYNVCSSQPAPKPYNVSGCFSIFEGEKGGYLGAVPPCWCFFCHVGCWKQWVGKSITAAGVLPVLPWLFFLTLH